VHLFEVRPCEVRCIGGSHRAGGRVPSIYRYGLFRQPGQVAQGFTPRCECHGGGVPTSQLSYRKVTSTAPSDFQSAATMEAHCRGIDRICFDRTPQIRDSAQFRNEQTRSKISRKIFFHRSYAGRWDSDSIHVLTEIPANTPHQISGEIMEARDG
jgi:hypothetical protein